MGGGSEMKSDMRERVQPRALGFVLWLSQMYFHGGLSRSVCIA